MPPTVRLATQSQIPESLAAYRGTGKGRHLASRGSFFSKSKGLKMENWYLIYTKPRCEDMVAQKLGTAGFTVLNPKIKERKYTRGKVVEAVSPLFPSYLFARFEKFRDYHLIRYTRGIKWVLRGEEGPAEIPESVIESITSRIESGFVSIRTAFAPGQSVIIKGGPFDGFAAIFEREMSGVERVSILLKAINVRVVMDRSMISAC